MEASELPKILYLFIIPLACPPEVEDNNRLFMEPREEYTTDTFLNQYSLKVHSKYLSLVPQKYVVLIIHHRRLFLKEMESVTESHNSSKYREQLTVLCPPQNNAFIMQPVHLMLRQYCSRGVENIVRARRPGNQVEDSLFFKQREDTKWGHPVY